MSVETAEETLFAARKGGRSTGVVHRDRNCRYLKRLDDADVLEKPPWAFDPEQRMCRHCADGTFVAEGRGSE